MKKLLLIITLSFLIALPTFSANVIVDNADKVLIQQGLTAIDNDTNQLHIIGTNLMKKILISFLDIIMRLYIYSVQVNTKLH